MGVAACLNCSVVKDTTLLKRCGGCKVVLYCSTECQKTSWKITHKYSCVYVPPLPSLGVEDFDKRFTKIVDRWVHEWRANLDHFAMISLDLANYPGRYVTHAMCMELRYTGSKTPARTFQFVGARICTVEEVLNRQPNLLVLRDPPGLIGHRVRYVLMFHLDPDDAKVRRFKIRAYALMVPLLCSKLEAFDKVISGLLAESVFSVAKKRFETGLPNQPKDEGVEAAMRFFF